MLLPSRIVAAVFISALLAPPLGACRSASTPTQQSKDLVVMPGKFAEVNVRMVTGAKVTATFAATGPLQWDTHSHPLGKTRYHDKGTAASGTISITAEKRETYSFLWQNNAAKSVKLRITMKLPRGTEVDSWVGHK